MSHTPALNQSWHNALKLYQQGQLKQAAHLCQQILQQKPSFSDPLRLLGVIYVQSNHADQGVKYLEKFLKKQPKDAQGWNQLGCAYRELSQFKQAQQAFLKSSQLKANDANVFHNLGQMHDRLNQADTALKAYLQAIKLDPDFVSAYNSVGTYYAKRNDFEKALYYFNLALEKKPDYAEAHYNVGKIYLEQKNYQQAKTCFEQALNYQENHTQARINLSIVYLEQMQFTLAEEIALDCVARFPDNEMCHLHLGNVYFAQANIPAALKAFRQAHSILPGFINAHHSEASCCLLLGDYQIGWEKHEWRLQSAHSRHAYAKRYTQPVWQGQDIRGKRLLVCYEQGFGDNIQFSRFLPLLKTTGAEIIVECRKPLRALFQESYGDFIKLADYEQPLPKYDYHIHSMSLPHRFNITLDNLPNATPYFKIPQDCLRHYQAHFTHENGFKIGIVWAGSPSQANDANRSCGLKAFEPLFSLPGIAWYSLQKDLTDNDSALLKSVQINTDIIASAKNYADTAAIIENLDLVISVCTSVAHLTGMLNKQVWLALCHNANWRWLMNRQDSPWYPSATLYRQKTPGDWCSVFFNIKRDLSEILIKSKTDIAVAE